MKVITRAQPAAATPAPDPKTAQLVSLQNLALEACAKGNYVEPRDANAIAYSQQALALDPTNGYTRTILEDSIKGGEFQVHQAILSKDFTTAHRVADVLAQLLPGESSCRGFEGRSCQCREGGRGVAAREPSPGHRPQFPRLSHALRQSDRRQRDHIAAAR